MPPQATPSADVTVGERGARAGGETWRTLARHQLGSLTATAVDFGVMIGAVSGLGLSTDLGTAIGAVCGGVTNFSMGRSWIFRGQSGHLGRQALRYALVSAASAAWNTLGEHFMTTAAHQPYVFARALVAIAVSLLWNFPMQRHFVFHEGR